MPELFDKPSPYTIKKGDTLSEIAARTGASVGQLAQANEIENPDRIFAGQTISVPATDGEYEIRRGQTLSGIASEVGVSVNRLAKVNQISNPDKIIAGETLIVPEVKDAPEVKDDTRPPQKRVEAERSGFGTTNGRWWELRPDFERGKTSGLRAGRPPEGAFENRNYRHGEGEYKKVDPHLRSIIATFFPGNLQDQAEAVLEGENAGYNPQAINTANTDESVDLGLFQINQNTFEDLKNRYPEAMERIGATNFQRDMKDPYKNAAVARLIYDDANRWHPKGPWGPWYGARGRVPMEKNELVTPFDFESLSPEQKNMLLRQPGEPRQREQTGPSVIATLLNSLR